VGERLDREWIEDALLDALGEVVDDGPGGSAAALGPVSPTHDRRAVDEHDLPVGPVARCRVEVDLAVRPEQGPGIGVRIRRPAEQPRDDLRRHLLEDLPEEVLLVPEVVVERTPREPGALDDLLRPGRLEPVGGELLAGCVEQGAARVLDVCGPAATGLPPVLIHDVSNIHTV